MANEKARARPYPQLKGMALKALNRKRKKGHAVWFTQLQKVASNFLQRQQAYFHFKNGVSNMKSRLFQTAKRNLRMQSCPV